MHTWRRQSRQTKLTKYHYIYFVLCCIQTHASTIVSINFVSDQTTKLRSLPFVCRINYLQKALSDELFFLRSSLIRTITCALRSFLYSSLQQKRIIVPDHQSVAVTSRMHMQQDGRRVFVALSAALALTAVSFLFLLISYDDAGSSVSLQAESPPVEYVPGKALQEQRSYATRMHMHYAYVPEYELPSRYHKQKKISVLADAAAPSGDAAAAGGDSNSSSFFAYERDSCAISNLITRAEGLFPVWDMCGYLPNNDDDGDDDSADNATNATA
jgi:hypothetical protein